MKHSHKDIVTILFVSLLLFFAPIESGMETSPLLKENFKGSVPLTANY